MIDTDTSVMQDRIGQLCHQFTLPTLGGQSVARFTEGDQGDALPTFLEVVEQEAEDRRHRRINRLCQESKLPACKAWETFEHDRTPLSLRQQMDRMAQGSFAEHGVNVLAFGLPGTGKTHAFCALGHRLVEAGLCVPGVGVRDSRRRTPAASMRHCSSSGPSPWCSNATHALIGSPANSTAAVPAIHNPGFALAPVWRIDQVLDRNAQIRRALRCTSLYSKIDVQSDISEVSKQGAETQGQIGYK